MDGVQKNKKIKKQEIAMLACNLKYRHNYLKEKLNKLKTVEWKWGLKKRQENATFHDKLTPGLLM